MKIRRTAACRFLLHVVAVVLTSTFGVGHSTLPFNDDAAQLKALVEKFFALYQKKDLDGAK